MIQQSMNPGRTPSQTYMKLKQEMDEAYTFQEILAVIKKYASSDIREKMERDEEAVKNLSESDRQMMIDISKSLPSARDIKILSEKIEEKEAVLQVQSTKTSSETGTVRMILENSGWKVKKESWSNK